MWVILDLGITQHLECSTQLSQLLVGVLASKS